MKTNRQYFVIEEVNGVYEQDLLSPSLAVFKNYITRPISYVPFKPEYVGNLDLLSHQLYGTEKLWWVIALTNDILDPFETELVGTLLKIPDMLDINDFYNDNYKSYSAFTE